MRYPPTTRAQVLPGLWARHLSDAHRGHLGRLHPDGDPHHHPCCGRRPEVGEAEGDPTDDADHLCVGRGGDRDGRQQTIASAALVSPRTTSLGWFIMTWRRSTVVAPASASIPGTIIPLSGRARILTSTFTRSMLSSTFALSSRTVVTCAKRGSRTIVIPVGP